MAVQQEDLTLHEYHCSGNCYKIRLTASLSNIKLNRLLEYDVLKGETRTSAFLTNVNASGKIPVLQIGPTTFLPESNAVMHYLAHGTSLIPRDRLEHAEMLSWQFWEQYSHEPHIATLRFWIANIGIDNLTAEQKAQIPAKRKAGAEALDRMERHLDKGAREWFVGKGVTLADLSLYAYTHVAYESGFFDLEDWPMVREWCRRIEALEGYVSMAD